jgi:GNAT superfamily N-acetyltransferase
VEHSSSDRDAAARVLAWRRAMHAAICDAMEPWEHGTVVRASRYPTYYDFNAIVVDDDPGMDVAALVAFADEALAGLDHRLFDFRRIEVADPLRAGFEALGWRASRLLYMRHEVAPPPRSSPPGPPVTVEEVPYDMARDLRVAWLAEDFPTEDPETHLPNARAVAMSRGVQVLAVRDGDRAIAFAQIERDGGSAEVTQVYVHPDHRGAGRGTAMTRAAIEAAGDAEDLWIIADDEDRPKELYARLGFRPVLRTMDFLRLPPARASSSSLA